jgi:hypothetical protein
MFLGGRGIRWTLLHVDQTIRMMNNEDHVYTLLDMVTVRHRPQFSQRIKGRQYSTQRSWLMTSQRAQNTNNTEYTYLNWGDYFSGIYVTWTQHIDRAGWCRENTLDIAFRRYRTIPKIFSWFCLRFRNESFQKNTGHDRYLILLNFPFHSTPCISYSPSTCCPDDCAVVLPFRHIPRRCLTEYRPAKSS